MTSAVQVLLATSAEHPDGEPGHELLDAALARRGITSRWAVWDDPLVDWATADVVVVRSTWDYDTRLADFLGWAQAVGPTLVHGARVLRWNTDRRYLDDLARTTRVPVVPTVLAGTLVALRGAVSRFGACVVRPRVAHGDRGVVVVGDPADWPALGSGPWVVQPWVLQPCPVGPHHEGCVSVFVVTGRPVGAVCRVTGRHGPSSHRTPLTRETGLLAVDAVAAATEITDAEIVCARIDLLHDAGRLVVSEVEVTAPGLLLDVLPGNADALADAIGQRL